MMYFVVGGILAAICFAVSLYFIRKHSDKIPAYDRSLTFGTFCVGVPFLLLLLWIVVVPLGLIGGICLLVYKWAFKLEWNDIFG